MNILLIEDDAIVAEVTKEILERVGYIVNIFLNVTDIVQEYKHTPPDCILLDFYIPAQTGLDKILIIRNQVDLTFVPIIVTTAATDTDCNKILQTLPNTIILKKPFEPERLLDIIKRVVPNG